MNCELEEFGRPRQSHKLEIVGSNPALATNYEGIKLKYEKINTLFKRDTKENKHVIMLGSLSKEEFNNVRTWSMSEKIDGMNIRVIYTKEGVEFRGRTDNAQIPATLFKVLTDMFPVEKLAEVFDLELADTIILYGEGYGAGIQSGGKYRDDQSFILFDVKIDEIWIAEGDVTRFALELGIDRVPLLGNALYEDVSHFVESEPKSRVGKKPVMEGVVARSHPLMLDRMGRRIIFKLKVKDFLKYFAQSEALKKE